MRTANKVVRILCLIAMVLGLLLFLIGLFPDIQTHTEIGLAISAYLARHFVGAAIFRNPLPDYDTVRFWTDAAVLIGAGLFVWQLANRKQRRDLSAISLHWIDLKKGMPFDEVKAFGFAALLRPAMVQRTPDTGEEIRNFAGRLYSMQFRANTRERNWELESWKLKEFSEGASRHPAWHTLHVLLLGD